MCIRDSRWSVEIFCKDHTGSKVVLFEGRFPSLHLAAEEVGMTYAQLNKIHKSPVIYGPHRLGTRWSPSFEVIKLCDGPRDVACN